ncbi:TetR/AcrR family transcriptional regulator [Nonomuraea sp. 3N208]|uniref:TetR/AcrR family transcriptional regulator n=1 Tax=Nonomuraea sp. 3N208 TaxID=3457421 RepID=UPI003FCE1072
MNDTAGEQGRRGRWRTGAANRQRIVEAAAARFGAEGFQRATIRAIAVDAGVDPAMIHYFFGSKQGLYEAVLNRYSPQRDPVGELLSEGVEHFGERLVRRFLEVTEGGDAADGVGALTRLAVTDREPAAKLREFIENEFAGSLAKHLDLPDAHLRASLIGAQLAGLAVARHLLGVEPLASASTETLVTLMAPVIQRLITEPLG